MLGGDIIGHSEKDAHMNVCLIRNCYRTYGMYTYKSVVMVGKNERGVHTVERRLSELIGTSDSSDNRT